MTNSKLESRSGALAAGCNNSKLLFLTRRNFTFRLLNVLRCLSLRKVQLTILITVASVMIGCAGLIAGLRVGLAISKPVVQSLVDTHAIPQSIATTIFADLDEGINNAAAAEAKLKKIPADLSKHEKQIAKARIYVELAAQLRTILDRHHIGGHKALDDIATIVNGVIAALEEYYRQVVTIPDAIARGEASRTIAQDSDPEATLKQAMEQAEKRLKEIKKQIAKGN